MAHLRFGGQPIQCRDSCREHGRREPRQHRHSAGPEGRDGGRGGGERAAAHGALRVAHGGDDGGHRGQHRLRGGRGEVLRRRAEGHQGQLTGRCGRRLAIQCATAICIGTAGQT